MKNDLERAIKYLSKAAELLNMDIVIPKKDNEDDYVDYILLATPNKVDKLIEKLEK